MKPGTLVELNRQELDALLQRIEPVLSQADYRMLKVLVDTFLFTAQWRRKNRLRRAPDTAATGHKTTRVLTRFNSSIRA